MDRLDTSKIVYANPALPVGCLAGLETLLAAAQKARSNLLEAAGGDEHLCARQSPLLFGEQNLVLSLFKLVSSPPESELELRTQFLNMLVIAEQVEPAIGIAALNVGRARLPRLDDAYTLAYGC